MARILPLGRYRLSRLLVGIELLEPTLRYMQSIVYWCYNMVRIQRLRDKIRKTESCSMYMTNHDIRLHSSNRISMLSEAYAQT